MNKRKRVGLGLGGFTIVELLIVIVVLGIIMSIVLLSIGPVQKRVRNTAMVSGVKQYSTAIEAYHSTNGGYPKPPDSSPLSDRIACLGEGYNGGVCLIEDVLIPPEVTNKSWLDAALKQLNSSLPQLPKNVEWLSNGHDLEAGAFYAYTDGTNAFDDLLHIYGIASTTAVIAYYLEGHVADMCKIPNSRAVTFGVDASSDKEITICVVPLGDIVYL